MNEHDEAYHKAFRILKMWPQQTNRTTNTVYESFWVCGWRWERSNDTSTDLAFHVDSSVSIFDVWIIWGKNLNQDCRRQAVRQQFHVLQPDNQQPYRVNYDNDTVGGAHYNYYGEQRRSELLFWSLWKQMLQEDAWHIIQRTQNDGICIWQQVNILARRQELLSTIKRCKLSWFGQVCRHDTLPKIIHYGTVDGSCRVEDCIYHGGTTPSNGQASHCHRCCASQTIKVGGWPSQRRRLLRYPQRRLCAMGVSRHWS